MRTWFLLIGVIALSACRPEQTAGSGHAAAPKQVPLSSVRLNPLRGELANGECRPITLDEFRAAGWRAAVLLVRKNGRDQRRVLVAVDSAGSLRRYSDIRFARDGWAVEAHIDAGVGTVSLWGPREVSRASAAEVLDSDALGVPRALAAEVMQTCATLLQGAGS